MNSVCTQTRHFEWKIHNFKEILENRKLERKLLSENFTIILDSVLTKWYFTARSNKEKWAVMLNINCFSNNFTVKFEAYIRGSGNKVKYRKAFIKKGREFSLFSEWGLVLFSFDDLSSQIDDFLENSTLTLCLNVQLIKNFQSDELNPNCLASCQYITMCRELFTTKSFSDLKIICDDDVKIHAHRFMLASFSPVMRAILEELSKANDGGLIFEVGDINSAVMTEILRFMYTQEILNTDKILPAIMYGAEKYEISKLKEMCVIRMIESLSITNALEYFILADKYNIKDLLDDAALFIKLHHDNLPVDTKWDMLEKKHWMVLLDFYRQNVKNVHIFESTI